MNTEKLFDLYVSMLRIRMVEEAVAEAYGDQQMRCPVHLSIGQEAVAVGVCSELKNSDGVFSAHRSHAHYLAKGGSLKRMLAEFYGRVTGCCRGRGGSMHLIDLEAGFLGSVPIVGSSIAIATGKALSVKLQKLNEVIVVFLGEGATEEGVFYESLNFAALQNLPIVFVCENNLYSVYTGMEARQPQGRSRVGIAEQMGLEVGEADGNNISQVCKLASQAVNSARQGGGPYFIEFDTYRWREHCGPNYDNNLGYRSPEEFEIWKKRCPLAACERMLSEWPQFDENRAHARSTIDSEIAEAFEFARESAFPTVEDSGGVLHG